MTITRHTSEPTIFEKSLSGRRAAAMPALDVPASELADLLPGVTLREGPVGLPEVSEPEVMRHYVRLSVKNHHIDKDFYPLGSCTMKHNPKVNEVVARMPGWARIHPCQPPETVPGAVWVMADLARILAEISGMDAVSLQPAAGAQGELTGLLMAQAWFRSRGEKRTKVLIPDSAHGTNPASVRIAGFQAVEIPSDARGEVDLARLEAALDGDVAVMMITNPNTLGLFETRIAGIAERLHAAGALLYMDGANLNALLGISRPGDMGADMMHINLHKTFTGPHGGGGPGSGPIAVKSHLEPFLPAPLPVMEGEVARLDEDRPRSIGRVHGFFGNFGIMIRAYSYIRTLGPDGLRAVSETAILNANYLMKQLEPLYQVAYPRPCMHEFVLSATRHKDKGVKALHIAKRLLDFGVHAPTVYFPLIVPEALMIEPTETETKETLDRFAAILARIAQESEETPDLVLNAPHETPVRRVDEGRAARELDLVWPG